MKKLFAILFSLIFSSNLYAMDFQDIVDKEGGPVMPGFYADAAYYIYSNINKYVLEKVKQKDRKKIEEIIKEGEKQLEEAELFDFGGEGSSFALNMVITDKKFEVMQERLDTINNFLKEKKYTSILKDIYGEDYNKIFTEKDIDIFNFMALNSRLTWNGDLVLNTRAVETIDDTFCDTGFMEAIVKSSGIVMLNGKEYYVKACKTTLENRQEEDALYSYNSAYDRKAFSYISFWEKRNNKYVEKYKFILPSTLHELTYNIVTKGRYMTIELDNTISTYYFTFYSTKQGYRLNSITKAYNDNSKEVQTFFKYNKEKVDIYLEKASISEFNKIDSFYKLVDGDFDAWNMP